MIWESATHFPRVVEGLHGEDGEYQFCSNTLVPAMLHTGREARRVGLRVYERVCAVSPSRLKIRSRIARMDMVQREKRLPLDYREPFVNWSVDAVMFDPELFLPVLSPTYSNIPQPPERLLDNIRILTVQMGKQTVSFKTILDRGLILEKLQSVVLVRNVEGPTLTEGNLTLVDIGHKVFEVKQAEQEIKRFLLRNHTTLDGVAATDAVRNAKFVLKKVETKTQRVLRQKMNER